MTSRADFHTHTNASDGLLAPGDMVRLAVSRGLKILAKELDCPVLALSQLSRRVEDRQGKRPQLSDLRESGAIEQDADVVMFIDRNTDARAEEETGRPGKGEAEVIVAKHRNGPTDTCRLAFLERFTRFAPLAKTVP